MRNFGKAIIKELKIRNKDFIWFLTATFAAWLFGVCILGAAANFTGAKGEWFSLGTLMGAIGLVIMLWGSGYMQNTAILDIALSMGQRRKDYYWANVVVTLLEAFLGFFLLIVLGLTEKWIFTGVYGLNESALGILNWIFRWGALILLFMNAVISLASIAVHRFGKVVSIPLSILTVSVCWMPMIFDTDQEAAAGSVMAGIRITVRNLAAWMTEERAFVLLVMTTIVALALGRVLVRKEAVKS